MTMSRISQLVESEPTLLPATGRVVVFRPETTTDLSGLPIDRTDVIQGYKPAFDHFARLGFSSSPTPNATGYGLAIVHLTRSKAQSRSLIAEAVTRTNGMVIVDGQKTDGIESILKDCRKKADVTGIISKSHGKSFVFAPSTGFDDWADLPTAMPNGFQTVPGVFSSATVDPGSQVLADELPKDLGQIVVDLGAGWGFLSREILRRKKPVSVHLVEAEHLSLECAKQNITDPRAVFHWEDALNFKLGQKADTVVMNPPFHIGRSGDPNLGKSFIRSAASLLRKGGVLWLVANRHLPYEADLSEHFRTVQECAGGNRFKVIRASL